MAIFFSKKFASNIRCPKLNDNNNGFDHFLLLLVTY